MTRPLMNGPRSLMRTMTLLPFFLLVTRTLVPKGRLRCAAVMADGFMRSPEAVFEVSAYQDAPPHWANAMPEERESMANEAAAMVNFRIQSISLAVELEGD